MTDNRLSGKAGIDTTDFKTGIAAMNRELRVLESGFRASTASLGDWSGNATALESRIKTLTSAMDIQKQKVAATRAEYERIKTEKGETSRAAQDLEIKLNKETETLGKMENELRTTEDSLQEVKTGSDEAGESVDELGDASDETSGQMDGFKTALAGVGTVVKATVGIVLGLVAAVAAVAGAVGALVFSTAKAAGELTDLSAKTGISTTALQEMDFIGKQLGVSLDTITGAQARMVRSMAGAKDGTGDQAKAFATLGVSIMDAQGNLRDTQAVFAETMDALGRIENPAERDAMAMSIFGKSAMELNPLIKTGSAGMAEMAAQAHELGAVMSDETVAAGDKLGDTIDALKSGLTGTLGTLAGIFMPGFQAVFDQLGGYLKTFSGIVSGSGGDFGKMAEGLTGLVTQIATDVAAQAPQMLEAGLAIVQSILTAITGALPQMLTAGIAILKSLIKFIVQNLPLIIDAAVDILLTLVDALIQNLPMLIDAALQAVITLANGLAAALPTLIPAIVQAIITIVNTLLENVPMLIEAALALIQGLADGLIAALPILIPAIPQILEAIYIALIASLPLIGEAAVQLIMALWKGIVGSLPMLGTAAVQIINVLAKGCTDLVKTLLDVGKDIVTGIWNGISSQKDWFYQQIQDFFGGIVDEVKNVLDMESPSKKMFAQGVNTIKGFSLGAQGEFKSMEKQLMLSFRGLSLAPAYAGSSGSGYGFNSSTQSEHYTFFAPVNIGTGAGTLGETLKGKRF